MKRITLMVAALVAFTFTNNANAQQVLSQSVDQTVIEPGVRCAGPEPVVYTSDNLWYRSYVLADYGITSDFEIGGVQFGIGEATTTFDVTVSVYLNTGVAFPNGTKTLLTSTTKTITPEDVATLVYADFSSPVTVPASSEIVVELSAPTLETESGFFSIGQNILGETGVSYLASVACGINVPTPITAIGFGDNIILNIAEEGALAIENQTIVEVSLYPNPVQDQLNITLPSSIQLESATMYDLLGKATTMNISENNTLNTANLTSGVYILKLETSQGTLTKKVIKK